MPWRENINISRRVHVTCRRCNVLFIYLWLLSSLLVIHLFRCCWSLIRCSLATRTCLKFVEKRDKMQNNYNDQPSHYQTMQRTNFNFYQNRITKQTYIVHRHSQSHDRHEDKFRQQQHSTLNSHCAISTSIFTNTLVLVENVREKNFEGNGYSLTHNVKHSVLHWVERLNRSNNPDSRFEHEQLKYRFPFCRNVRWTL